MNRLRAELERLYGLDPASKGVESQRRPEGVRVAVLAVILPAGWAQLGPVWRGVQTDLELPAPAIAVSGVDALQLWFSFASPTAPDAALSLLQGLGERYLTGVKPAQWRACVDAAALPAPPCREVEPEHWSAFVTPDLASVFDDTPWLDLPSTDDGQGAILHGLGSIRPEALDSALSVLGVPDPTSAVEVATTRAAAFNASMAASTASSAPARAMVHRSEPVRFLSKVMNDETAPLALRIEAARILLSNTTSSEP